MKKVAKTRAKEDTGELDPGFMPVAAAFADASRGSRAKMFSSSSVLKLDGKMFAMLVKGKFVAKLPREKVNELVSNGTGKYIDPGHGRLMKEWIAIDGGKASWVELAREAYRFVKGAKS